MRVALLTQNARAGDAIGRHVAEKAAYFLDRGADVRVIVGDERGIHPALRPYAIRGSDRPTGPAWRALVDCDLLVVDYPQYYPQLDLLPLLADGKRRILLDYHGVTPPMGRLANHREQLWRGRDYRGLAGFADVALTHSRFAERELCEDLSIPDERKPRIGYVIDEARFTPGPPLRSLRQRLGLADARLLLFVGRLAPNKRVPTLVMALAELRELHPPVHAVIVGPSGDCYQAERLTCREVAADRGVSDRLHFLGDVDEATLLDCYRSADVFVMPSIHEGFCLPVIEAMACGLPVVAARAAALPETIGDAGLTFTPEDPKDLARVIRCVAHAGQGQGSKSLANLACSTHPTTMRRKIAVVTPGYGPCAGGAERSLTLIAKVLHDAGMQVDVLTTRTDGNSSGPSVRTFTTDPIDPSRREGALDSNESTAEATYFANTLRSSALVSAVGEGKYDAVVVGPFGTGLTRDVVRIAGRRAILVPCLHDEPAAHTATVREMFVNVGGVLFHSEQERELAQSQFGFNHPNSNVIGTWLDTTTKGDAARGHQLATCQRYVLVCGRKVREKNLPELIAWARSAKPDQFRFVFVGDGDYPIPQERWAVDLGRVSEQDKRDLMAGAEALIQLSANESLSLVVLEAQSAGIPVIVNAANPVLKAHIENGSGGWAVTNEQQFHAALNVLWDKPDIGTERGHYGRMYVECAYGNRESFAVAVTRGLDNLDCSLVELMRERGVQRASQFSRDKWRVAFDQVVDQTLESHVNLSPATVDLSSAEVELVNAPSWDLRLHHRAGRPLVPTGPGRSEIIVRIRDVDGEVIRDNIAVALGQVDSVGQEHSISILLPALSPASYSLEAGIRTYQLEKDAVVDWHGILANFNVTTVAKSTAPQTRLLQVVHEIRSTQQLPDSYVDVSTGRGASVKKWIKNKILHNFRTSYVDVIARQQSRFNQQVTNSIAAVAELPATQTAALRAELAATRAQCEELRDRMAKLEAEEIQDPVTVGGRP